MRSTTSGSAWVRGVRSTASSSRERRPPSRSSFHRRVWAVGMRLCPGPPRSVLGEGPFAVYRELCQYRLRIACLDQLEQVAVAPHVVHEVLVIALAGSEV